MSTTSRDASMAAPDSGAAMDTGLPAATAAREPRGFGPRYFAASAGIYLAVFAPVFGGLSVKVQSLVPLGQAATTLGLVTGIGAIFALISQPLIGRLSDRTRGRLGMRKPWIIAGSAGTFLSLVGVGAAPNIAVLIIAWSGAQFFSNAAQVGLTATIADQVPEERRGRISSLVGASSSVSILIAAAGLTYLATNFLRSVVPGALGLIVGLLFAFTLKDRILRERPGKFSAKELLSSFAFNPVTYRNLGVAWLTKAMIMLGFGALTSYLTLFVAVDFGMTSPGDQLRFNLWATFILVGFNVLFAFLGGLWSDRTGKRRVFVSTGGMLIGAGALLAAVAPALGHSAGLAAILAGEALIGAGSGFFLSVDTALVLGVLPNPQDMAKDIGVLNIANTLPQTLAPFIAGLAIIPLGNTLFHAGYSLWFAAAAASAVGGAALVYRIKGVR